MLQQTTGLYKKAVSESVYDKTSEEPDPKNPGKRKGGAWTRGGALYMLGINYRWSSIVYEERDSSLLDKEANQALIAEMEANAYGGGYPGVCAGDRAPEAPGLVICRASKHIVDSGDGGETSLFKLLSPSKHSIFVFTSSSALADASKDTLGGIAERPAAKDIIQAFVICRSAPPDGALESLDGVDGVLVDRDGHAHDGYHVKDDGLTVVIVRPDGYIGAIVKDRTGVKKYFRKILSY